ncbi:MAG: putative Ca2+-binding actin-bundling protein [Streblomastix strix]|uniref:Putative Ca2+-binding actin-bundling protein n=1 Tax=Streblomastix strix TaxID=222440 RepID=A0A5J4XBK6_9EUKA|nr:MAG: putative Ca2+-binding actin-bundling protein [Streblomastix strix]
MALKFKTTVHVLNMVGQQESSMHTYAEEEKTAYVEFINQNLIGDPELANKLPINSEGNDIFEIMKDGLLIMKMVNFIKPGTIDDRLFNKNARNQFQTGENLTVVLDGARSIGCKLQGITSKNIQEGNTMLVFSLMRQLVTQKLTTKINLVDHPEIFRLVKENESLDAFKNLASEMRLLRWFNYHLEKAGHSRRVVNISEDLKDGENYTILLNQLNKKKCSTDPLQEKDLNKRAELVLENSEKLGCKRFIKASDITNGNKELNLAFIADLFNKCPGFDEFDEKELNDAQRRILEEARKQREEEDRMWRKERDDDLRKRHLSIKMLDQEEEQKRRAMEEAARKKAEIEQEAELASKKKKEMEQQTEEMGRQKRELEEQLRKMKEEAKEFELRKQREKEEEEERKKKEEEERKKKEEEEKFTRVLEEIRQKKEEIERKRKEEEEKKRKELEEQERLEEERRKRKMQDLEELKRKQEEDERRREEDEKKRKESEEERRLIEEEKRKLEDEKRKLAEMKKKEEEERRRREEEEQKRREEEERKRREEEQQRLQEEQDRKTREIADRKRREYELELELQRRRDQENEEMEKRLKLAEEKLRKEDEEKKKRERELQREKEREKRKKEEEEKRRKQKERELELKKLEEQEETEDQLKRRALEERNLLEQELYDYTHGTPQTFQPVITDTQLRGDGVIQSLLTGDQSKDDLIFELCDDEDNTDKKIMDDRKKQADVVDENIFWFGKQADSTRLLEMAEKEVRTLFEDADRFKRKYDDKKKKQDDESKKEKANTKDKDKEKEKDKQQMFVGRELEKFFETDLEEQRQKDKDKLRAKEAEKEKTKDKDKDKDKSGKRKRSPSPNNDLFGDDEDGWIYLSPFLLTDVLLIHEYERKRLQYSVLRQQSINEWLQKHKQKDNRPIDIWQAGLEQLLGEGFSGWTLDDRKWILSELEKEGGGKIGANKIIQRHVDRYKRALKVDISLWPYTQPDTKGKIQSPASKQSTLKESDQPSKEQYEAKKDLLEADADLTIILLSRTSVTHIPLLTDPEFIGLLTDCLARHKRDLSYYPLASMIALLCRREDNHKAIISTNAHKLRYDIVKDPTKAGAAPISFSEMCCFLATSERGKITLLESGDKDYAAKAKMILVMYGNLDEYATRYVTGFFYQITKSKQYVPILKDKGVDKEIIDLLNRQATASSHLPKNTQWSQSFQCNRTMPFSPITTDVTQATQGKTHSVRFAVHCSMSYSEAYPCTSI